MALVGGDTRSDDASGGKNTKHPRQSVEDICGTCGRVYLGSFIP